jgi:putative ABC transport system substrate-binding protein
MGVGLMAKDLQLLREAVPRIARITVLWNPTISSNITGMKEIEIAAKELAVELQPLEVRQPEDLDKAFAIIARDRPDALFPFDTDEIAVHRRRIIEFALKHGLPTAFNWKFYADAGGLIAYGPSLRAQFAGAAVYVDKVLRGARPAELPIELPTKFELVINMKTAKALGLKIPPSLLLRADQVIE